MLAPQHAARDCRGTVLYVLYASNPTLHANSCSLQKRNILNKQPHMPAQRASGTSLASMTCPTIYCARLALLVGNHTSPAGAFRCP